MSSLLHQVIVTNVRLGSRQVWIWRKIDFNEPLCASECTGFQHTTIRYGVWPGLNCSSAAIWALLCPVGDHDPDKFRTSTCLRRTGCLQCLRNMGWPPAKGDLVRNFPRELLSASITEEAGLPYLFSFTDVWLFSGKPRAVKWPYHRAITCTENKAGGLSWRHVGAIWMEWQRNTVQCTWTVFLYTVLNGLIQTHFL